MSKRSRLDYDRFVVDTSSALTKSAESSDREREILIRSQDRVVGTTVNNAQFNVEQTLRGVTALQLTSFTFLNTLNNVFLGARRFSFSGYGASGPPAGPRLVNVDFQFSTGFWSCAPGYVSYSTVQSNPLGGLGDIRWEILRQAAGILTSVGLDPVSGKIILNFAADPTIIWGWYVIMAETTASWLGFAGLTDPFYFLGGDASGDPFSATLFSKLNLSTKKVFMLCSPELASAGGFISTDIKRASYSSSTFAYIPVTTTSSEMQVYEPHYPVVLNYPTVLQEVSALSIQLRDTDGSFLTEIDQDWQLVIKVSTQD